MEALEAIAKRTSTRKFKETQIPEENLQAILKAGMAAPVGSGAYSSLHITVVQNQSVFSKINAAVTELIFKMMGKKMDKNFGAPTMIFVSSKPAMMPGLEYANTACVLSLQQVWELAMSSGVVQLRLWNKMQNSGKS